MGRVGEKQPVHSPELRASATTRRRPPLSPLVVVCAQGAVVVGVVVPVTVDVRIADVADAVAVRVGLVDVEPPRAVVFVGRDRVVARGAVRARRIASAAASGQRQNGLPKRTSRCSPDAAQAVA